MRVFPDNDPISVELRQKTKIMPVKKNATAQKDAIDGSGDGITGDHS